MFKFKSICCVIILFFIGFNLNAQDTIKVMHYNLLYYGKTVYDCTSTTNNRDEKNENLKTIIQYVKPDIFSVNELDGESDADAKYLLDNALNVDGVTSYRKTEFPETYLANTIFYNVNKLVLKRNNPISYILGGYKKFFNVFQFYFNSDNLEVTNDTAFIYCAVTHLKAGNDPNYELQRAYETSLIMDYFETLGQKGNYMIMGDFNVYTPTEECFQNLINPDNSLYTFYDPADQIGEWSSNYNYRFVHTQSTHITGDCFSGGGMDDRFDFILASDYIMNGTNHFEYITDSYKAIGQDGSSYNGSLNTTSNSAVPNNVANALYNMSDHLPVYLELKVDQNRGEPLIISDSKTTGIKVFYNNPASEVLNLQILPEQPNEFKIEIFTIKGEKVFEYDIVNKSNIINLNISVLDLPNGIYLLNITSQKEFIYSSKILIQN
jgi:hypothetical protein